VAGVVEKVSVELDAPPGDMLTLVGLRAIDGPFVNLGDTSMLRITIPVNWFKLSIVMLELLAPPIATVAEVGLSRMSKSGGPSIDALITME